MVSSLFGMNLINGMEDSPLGFPLALLISVIVSGHMVDFAPQTAYLAAERKKLRIFLGGINYFV